VPVGAGLSSSAALEVASAQALLSLEGREVPFKEVAQLCQRAENEFVGAHVGIMDQFVSCYGLKDHALLLDCRALEFEQVPVPRHVDLVICNTMVKHELSGGEYNLRRKQCEQGVRILSRKYPGIKALRDVTRDQLLAEASSMPPVTYNRCRHVVEENTRTLEAARLFRRRNLVGVGCLMRESHASLRDLYEVSCPELDAMVESAEGLPGYLGGRMTGGGFGGCTVNLVEAAESAVFAKKIAERYREATGIAPEIYVSSAADGAAEKRNKRPSPIQVPG
jgi:galactokinase